LTPRRRKALEALVARGATQGEREAARQALAKADRAAREHAPPRPNGPSRGLFGFQGGGFTITFDGKETRFDTASDIFLDMKAARERDVDRSFVDELLKNMRAQSKPPPPGPFGDGSSGPGPRKCEPKPKGEAKFGAPRSCGYAFNATFVPSSKSPTGEICYLVHGLLASEATRFKVSGDPVILTEDGAEFGARCTCWTQPEPGERVLTYFERMTVTGRLEATLEDTCGMYVVPCSREQALAYQAADGLYLVTYKGRTWVCRPGGPKWSGNTSGCAFHAVATRPAS